MGEDDALTFSELRKIQKEERRKDELSDLDEDFVADVIEYLSRKKDVSGESREYKNARRVFRKIISLREDKIVKNAQLAVTSNVSTAEMNILPREEQLFRQLKETFSNHRDRISDFLESEEENVDSQNPEVAPKVSEQEENDKEAEAEENDADDEEMKERLENDLPEPEEGYKHVKIQSDVPEFMGTDLEAYGPFEGGDTAEVPEDNAKILENRGNAEVIE
jgi:DNA replication initiation complex subunit (GINS family)